MDFFNRYSSSLIVQLLSSRSSSVEVLFNIMQLYTGKHEHNTTEF